MNSLIAENKNKTKTVFELDNLNIDLKQSQELDVLNKKLLDKNNLNLINDKFYNSVKDNIDYLGCINGNCKSINCSCNKEACQCTTENNNKKLKIYENTLEKYFKNNKSKKNYEFNLKNFFDILLNILFIILVFILCIFAYYYRKTDNLIYILVLSLIFIFYKILINK